MPGLPIGRAGIDGSVASGGASISRTFLPMTRLVTVSLILFALCITAWFGAHQYAEYRLRSALLEAGLTDKAAACMGRRVSKRLSLGQLRKLTALQAEKHSLRGLVKAVRRMDDPEIVDVTSTAALLCTTGFAR